MDATTLAWIGGIGGSLLGIAGGVFGTYCSIASAKGPRERAFMIRASICTWIVVLAFLGGMMVLPSSEQYYLWIPYPFLLMAGIIYMNRTLQRLKAEEARVPA